MGDRIESALVRVLRTSDGRPAGCGFLVGPGRVLTCAHVVADALGFPEEAEGPLAAVTVNLEFPFLDYAPAVASIDHWSAVESAPGSDRGAEGGDVAGLIIEGDPPPAARWLTLAPGDPLRYHHQEFEAWGDARSTSAWVTGEISRPGSTGRLQLDSHPGRAAIEIGFSGSPVFVGDPPRVVGMTVTAKGGDVPMAWAITAPELVKAWKELRDALRCPYRGLSPFTLEDREDFYGRQGATQDLLSLARDSSLVAVVGASGSGKSSVVFAGLLARLDDEGWQHAIMTPGTRPLANLARALGATDSGDGSDVGPDDARRALRAVRHARRAGPLVVIVDQLEQLFGPECDPDERRQFEDLIVEMTDDDPGPHPIKVVLTLRSDFLDDLEPHALARATTWFHLDPLEEAELREAIVEPARARWSDPTPDLVSRLVQDVGGRSSRLPLLQFCLTLLWDRELTVAAYEELGGIEGALARYANDVFENDLDDTQQGRARYILAQLVTPGEDAPDAARRLVRSELALPCDWSVVERLAEKRLLVVAGDGRTGEEWAELAHDALIRDWDVLRDIVNEYRRFRLWQDRTEAALHLWRTNDEDAGCLLRGPLLVEARRHSEERPGDIDGELRMFIQLSQVHDEQERQRLDDLSHGLRARRLAAAAARERADPRGRLSSSVLRAAEAVREQHCLEADLELRAGLALLPQAPVVLAHGGRVGAVAWSPAGDRLVTAGAGRSVIWDASTGCRLTPVVAEEDPEAGGQDPTLVGQVVIAWRPGEDDTYVATASAEHGAWLWLGSYDVPLRRLAPPEVEPVAVAFAPDGRRVATLGRSARMVLGDQAGAHAAETAHFEPDPPSSGCVIVQAPDGEKAGPFVQRGRLTALAWSPDGKHLVIGDDEATALVWDVDHAVTVLALEHGEPITAAAWAPDGTMIAIAGGGGTTQVWDWEARAFQASLAHKPESRIATLSWHPETGRGWLATGGSDRTARVWDARRGIELCHLNHGGAVTAVAWAPSGDRLATVAFDRRARVWDPDSEAEVARLDHDDDVTALAWAPDGRRVATASADGTSRVWTTDTGAELVRLVHGREVRVVAWSPDGCRLATASQGAPVCIWDWVTGREVSTLGGDEVRAMAWSPEGSRLATGGLDATVRVWDWPSGTELATMAAGSDVRAVAWGPEGTQLMAGGPDGVVRVWDVATGEQVASLSHGQEAADLAWGAERARLVTAGGGTVCIRDVASGEQVARIDHTGELLAVAWSPASALVAGANGDGSLDVWDAISGVEVARFNDAGALRYLAWNHSGDRLVATCFESSAQVWDVRTGVEVARLTHGDGITAVSWSPEGNRVATAGRDGTVRIWTVDQVELVEQACRRLGRHESVRGDDETQGRR